MSCPSRSHALRSSFVLAAIVVAHAGPEARAQSFDYAIKDAGAGGALGTALARLGDVDGDGCEDFVVGEPNLTVSSVPGTGIVRLESGKTGSQMEQLLGNPGANYGASVAGRIDVDGDGFEDLIIGAPLDTNTKSHEGLIYAYSPHFHSFPFYWYGNNTGGHFGASVKSLESDLDSDGVDDFIVGEPGVDGAAVISSAGSVVLFTLFGQPGSGFGTDVCRGGDLDNDGTGDFLVGAPDFVDSFGSTPGRVLAYSGATGNLLWTVDGAPDSKFGQSLTQPGDLDGDGEGDIVVGVPRHLDSSSNSTGCATVLSGSSHAVLYKVFGDAANDTFGHSVHGVGGDIDSDGTNDFIVGAPQLLGSAVGYARTISGATGATLYTFTGHTSDPNTKSNYGSDVAGGDFDGDGRTDVVIGGSNFANGDGIVETWTTVVAHWKNYGAGWPGTSGVPAFVPQKDPAVGKSLKLDLANSRGVATPALLMLGLGKASIPSGKGGTILVSPLLYLSLSIPAAGVTLSGQVPDDPSLYGLDLYLQAIELDPGASKGLSFTRGLDLYFGYD
jgi:FG-GAP repeat protein